MSDPLTLTLDVPEQRVTVDRLAAVTNGRGWDVRYARGAGVDNVTYTGMLMPVPFDPLFQTAGTGDYARLRASALATDDPSQWYEVQPGFSGNYYQMSRGTADAGTVWTNASWTRNRGMFISWRTPGWGGSDPGTALECGWVAPGQDLSLRFMTNGDVQVWDGTAHIGDGNLRFVERYRNQYGGDSTQSATTAGVLTNMFVSCCLIPCRDRELLVLSTADGGFNTVIPRIPPDAVDPTITAAGPFWFYVPHGQAQVQLMPMRYARAGTVTSAVHYLRYQPGTVDPTVSLYYGTPGYGSVTASGTVTNTTGGSLGTATQARLRMEMTGDGISSPWLYGITAQWDGSAAMSWAGTADVTDYQLQSTPIALSVPENPNDVTLTFALANPAELDTGSLLYRASTLQNRSVELTAGTAAFGTVTVFKGRTQAPRMRLGMNDDCSEVLFDCRDQWAVLDNYRIQEPLPFDGQNLGSAVAGLVTMCGFGTAQLDIGSVDFNFERVGHESQGEWALIPEVGDTPGQWLTRIRDDYCPTWYMGWRPGTAGPTFTFKSQAQLGTDPSVVVWPTSTSAGGTVSQVWRSFEERTLPIEANDVWVIGADPRTRAPIQVHIADTVSQDPTLAGTARPENWLGEIRRYSWVNPAIVGTATASWCAGLLYDRLTRVRRIAQVECEMQFNATGLPLWTGDVMQVRRVDTIGNYRISAMSMESQLEAGTASAGFGWQGLWRPTTYTLELIAETDVITVGNAGFETAGAGGGDVLASWTEGGNTAFIGQSAVAHSGSKSAKLTADAGAAVYVSQTFSVLPTNSYTLAVWTRAGAAGQEGRFRVVDVTHSMDIVALTATGVTGTTYAQASSTFQVPTGCTSMRIELWCPATGGQACYFDDVSVTLL